MTEENCEGNTYVTNIYIGGKKIGPLGHFNWSIGLPMLKQKGEVNMLELTITNEQKVKVTVNPVTSAGNVVELDGDIAVEVSSGEGTVEMVDATSFYCVSGDLPGDTVYTVSGDADLGEGVENIADAITLHVEGAKASSLGLAADPPELK